jgi:dTDP-4-dehydrorhamnose reductase
MTRILVTGANGQLGAEILAQLTPIDTITAIGTTRDRLDLADPDSIRHAIVELEPDIILSSGAYTAVDRAESEPELAHAVNAIAPGLLAEATAQRGAKLIHLSTDYVFDGQKGSPYLETDPTGAIGTLGTYGQTKLDGERAILAADPTAAIVRTAWVYGVGGTGNFVKTMLRLGKEREELRVVADQIGSPSWTGDIATAIVDLALNHSDASGVFQFTNSGVASWYDFAVAIFEEAAALDFPLAVQRVIPITTADYPTSAKRPAYSVLAGGKLATLRGTIAPHWRDGLRSMLTELRQVSD